MRKIKVFRWQLRCYLSLYYSVKNFFRSKGKEREGRRRCQQEAKGEPQHEDQQQGKKVQPQKLKKHGK